MTIDEAAAWEGEFVVVETDNDWYLGTLRLHAGRVTVYTGYTGRPPVIDVLDIESVTAAADHAAVEHALPAGSL